MFTVSVVIPLYNKRKYIKRALDSVFAQSFQDYEIIVVDDGSTDDGPDIVRQYNDTRIKIIHQKNTGPGSARNRGVKESGGEYIAFLDADDEWLPDFLSISLQHLKDNIDCALSTVGFCFNEIKGIKGNQFEFGKYELPCGLKPEQLKQEIDKCHSAGTVLCRREVFGRFKGFYENHCLYGEDVYLWIQVMLNYPIFCDPRVLMVYHTQDSELSLYAKGNFKPPKPYLTDPEPIRNNCPDKYRDMLEEFLSYYALNAYHCCLGVGKKELCSNFEKDFPLMKKWRWEYIKLRIKRLCPFLLKYKI